MCPGPFIISTVGSDSMRSLPLPFETWLNLWLAPEHRHQCRTTTWMPIRSANVWYAYHNVDLLLEHVSHKQQRTYISGTVTLMAMPAELLCLNYPDATDKTGKAFCRAIFITSFDWSIQDRILGSSTASISNLLRLKACIDDSRVVKSPWSSLSAVAIGGDT